MQHRVVPTYQRAMVGLDGECRYWSLELLRQLKQSTRRRVLHRERTLEVSKESSGFFSKILSYACTKQDSEMPGVEQLLGIMSKTGILRVWKYWEILAFWQARVEKPHEQPGTQREHQKGHTLGVELLWPQSKGFSRLILKCLK